MTDDVDAPTAAGPTDPLLDTTAAAPLRGEAPGGTPVDGNGAQGPSDRPAPKSERNVKRLALEWAILIAVAVVIAIVIKTFLFQAFYIPSGSMEPTLDVGDRVLVNKLSYDLHDLHRGDIVVFSAGPNPDWHRAGISDLVKRVIALPGETVSQCGTSQVCIDGKLLQESYLPKGTVTVIPDTLPYITDAQGKRVRVCDKSAPGTCKVPAGEVFVMGDNRGNSQDARSNGPIKESSIVGRVFLRIWPPGRIGLM